MNTEAHFEDIDFHIIQALKSANESIKICVAWINGNKYLPIFHELTSRGVNIEVIHNDDFINNKNPIISHPAIEVYPINTRIKSALMHNKFCIIDNETLITGSFNWSINAKNSFENVIVINKDYHLIKKYLHEFYDLVNYYQFVKKHKIEKCDRCKSYIYHLGIFREESGKYSESDVQVYKICTSNFHVSLISKQNEQFLHSMLFPESDNQYYFEKEFEKDMMLEEFRNERHEMERIQEYFRSRHGIRIHAVGCKYLSNQNEHLKWDYPQELEIKLLWRDMFYRKIIPSVLYDGQGEIEAIINDTIY